MNTSIVRRIIARTSVVRVRSWIHASVLVVLWACNSRAQLPPQCPPLCINNPDASVLTHHNDNTRSGAQLNESILSPYSISPGHGQLQVTSTSGTIIKGVVNAQPLYVQGVPFGSFSLDVVYVVDSTNTVYSFIPAENWTPLGTLKVRTLEPPDGTEMLGQRGILSTPAIDKARNLMYVVARAADDSVPAPSPYTGHANAKFILHVLDLRTLADAFPPTTIRARIVVPGGTATFVPIIERQRTALLLNQVGGRSYLSLGFGGMPGSLGEGQTKQHGWAFTYDVTNAPVLTNAYASSRYPDNVTLDPSAGVAGIWQGGAGFAADKFGNVFLSTGNGMADGNNDGDSIVRLTSDGARFWNALAPNQHTLEEYDRDLGGGGPIVLPHDSGASRVFVIGKDGSAILVRVYDDIVNNPAVIQSFQAAKNPAADGKFYDVFWGGPVYWNSNVYYVGSGDYLKSLPWDPSSGIFTSTTPTSISQDPEPGDEGFNGQSCGHRSLSLSANGTSGAILWLARSGGGTCPGELDAYDPTRPNSPPLFQWSTQSIGPNVYLARFPMATVAGGHVFLVTVDGPSDSGNGPSTLLQFSLSRIQ